VLSRRSRCPLPVIEVPSRRSRCPLPVIEVDDSPVSPPLSPQRGPRDSALAVAESKHQSQAQCLDVSSVDVSGLTAGTDPSDGCLNGADPDDLFLSDIEEILETERLVDVESKSSDLDGILSPEWSPEPNWRTSKARSASEMDCHGTPPELFGVPVKVGTNLANFQDGDASQEGIDFLSLSLIDELMPERRYQVEPLRSWVASMLEESNLELKLSERSDVPGAAQSPNRAAQGVSGATPEPEGEVAELLAELALVAEALDPADYWSDGAWDVEVLKDDVQMQRAELQRAEATANASHEENELDEVAWYSQYAQSGSDGEEPWVDTELPDNAG